MDTFCPSFVWPNDVLPAANFAHMHALIEVIHKEPYLSYIWSTHMTHPHDVQKALTACTLLC